MIKSKEEQKLADLTAALKALLREAVDKIEEYNLPEKYSPHYGDIVKTVDGKEGKIKGSLASWSLGCLWMVKIDGLPDDQQPWYVAQQLTLIKPGKETSRILHNEELKYNFNEPICFGLYSSGNFPKDNPNSQYKISKEI